MRKGKRIEVNLKNDCYSEVNHMVSESLSRSKLVESISEILKQINDDFGWLPILGTPNWGNKIS